MAPLWTFQVTEELAHQRADAALTQAIQNHLGEWSNGEPESLPSRSQIQKHFEQGAIQANGKPLSKGAALEAGMHIQYECPEPVMIALEPRDVTFDLLYEDEHLAVVDKPQGLNVHPASSNPGETTLVHGLLARLKNLSAIGDVYRPGIVHRLDKMTSGVMVISKTNAAHQALAGLFSTHTIHRQYWALCYGEWRLGPMKRVETGIGRNPNERHKMTVRELGETGVKQAITVLKPIQLFRNATLMEATLHTGRTHQVRVHLNSLGHSVMGDPLYGVPGPQNAKWKNLSQAAQSAIEALPGQALHARVLGFKHPITGKDLHFETQPPSLFQELLACL